MWDSFSNLDFGVQKKLKNNAGTFRFAIADIFNNGHFSGGIDDPKINFKYRTSYGVGERIFRLIYSKRFGSDTVKSARNRATGSAEEQQRASG